VFFDATVFSVNKDLYNTLVIVDDMVVVEGERQPGRSARDVVETSKER